MAPVAGRPFLRYALDQLSDSRFEHVVIADGYLRDQIEDYFGSRYRNLCITYSTEEKPLLTGGAVKKALTKCNSDWVFVLNGDTWTDVDFATMEETATSENADISVVLAVKKMRKFDRYGTVELSSDGTIVDFLEKKPVDDGYINAGIYLLKRDPLDPMPARFSLEDDFFKSTVNRGSLRAVKCQGSFIDIGIPEDYLKAQSMLQALIRHWKLAIFRSRRNHQRGHRTSSRTRKSRAHPRNS